MTVDSLELALNTIFGLLSSGLKVVAKLGRLDGVIAKFGKVALATPTERRRRWGLWVDSEN